MARHCSSVTVVVPCAIGAVGSGFSGDIAGDTGGTGDTDGACNTGGAGGAGEAVVDFFNINAVAAVSDDFAASAVSAASVVSGATSASPIIAAAFSACLSLLFEPSAIAMRTTGMVWTGIRSPLENKTNSRSRGYFGCRCTRDGSAADTRAHCIV